jgi:hypothetical protein
VKTCLLAALAIASLGEAAKLITAHGKCDWNKVMPVDHGPWCHACLLHQPYVAVFVIKLCTCTSLSGSLPSPSGCQEGKDCETGLTCYKGTCEDRDPPVITLDFGNGIKSAPALTMMPKVELKFPGSKKSVDCNDIVEECDDYAHPNCQAARAGAKEAVYWRKYCRKSCGLCALEVKAEKSFEKAVANFDEVHEKNLGHLRKPAGAASATPSNDDDKSDDKSSGSGP